MGDTVVLSAAGSGTLPLTFSWRLNGPRLTNIVVNTTTCFLTIPNIQLTNAGTYKVGIVNEVGASLLSNGAVLTVLADGDGDGMPDSWEIANGLDPEDATDGVLDADGDGMSNRQEYLAGTDPNSAASKLRIENISLSSDSRVKLEFAAISNRTYGVEFRDESPTGNWIRMAEFPDRFCITS